MRGLTPSRLAETGSEWPSISIRIVIDRCSAAMSFITEASWLVNGRPRSQERSKTSTR